MIYSSLALGALGLVSAAIEADKITKLPGFQGDLPSVHYSGYLPVGQISGTKGHLHYWLIESENDPSSDPIVLWLNGGPGSSSLIGLLTENGQIQTNDDSLENPVDGVPQVFYNGYGWTTKANMLYLESPKGVGFSYCDDAKSSSECVNTDESTAQDSYEFLVNFFAAFPEYKSNKFYITGESYAGIYIPMLMDQIRSDSMGAKLNFQGSAIGNGCWGNTVGTCDFSSTEAYHISSEFYYGHGMYSETLHAQIAAACGDWSSYSPACLAKLSEMEEEIGTFNIYNIYDECGRDQRRLEEGSGMGLMEAFRKMGNKTVDVETTDSFKRSAGYSGALNDYTCGAETAMDTWLAEPSVIEALHVKAGTVGMKYDKTATDLRPLYADLMQQYQMLIYSGDTDGCVPYVGTEAWTRDLGYSVVADWHQWFSKPDMEHASHKSGYAVTYDKFQFVTVNGAGHMVPEYQPGFALHMFEKFLANEVF